MHIVMHITYSDVITANNTIFTYLGQAHYCFCSIACLSSILFF